MTSNSKRESSPAKVERATLAPVTPTQPYLAHSNNLTDNVAKRSNGEFLTSTLSLLSSVCIFFKRIKKITSI